MKTLKSFVWMLALTAAILSASCSGSSSLKAKLDKYVSDDTQFVLTGNLKRAVEATGSSVDDGAIKPAGVLQDLMGTLRADERDMFNKVLNFKGMDWNDAVVAVRLTGMNPEVLIIWSVTNEKEFARSLSEAANGVVEVGAQDDFVTVGDEQSAMVLKDNMGFCVVDGQGMVSASKAISIINTWAADAEKKPLASWKKDRLAADHILNGMASGKLAELAMAAEPVATRTLMAQVPYMKEIMDKYAKGFVVGYLDLNGPSLQAEMSVKDAEGKDMDFGFDFKDINTDLLKYGSSKDLAAVGFGSGDIIQKALLETFKAVAGTNPMPAELTTIFDNVFGGMSGTILAMAGPATDNIQEMDKLNAWVITGVIEYADAAKASAALDAIASVLKEAAEEELTVASHTPGSAVEVVITSDDYSNASFDYETADYVGVQKVSNTLSLRTDGANLIVSTAKQKGDGSAINKDLLAGNVSAFAIEIPKDNKSLSMFNVPFGVKCDIVSNGSTTKTDITLTDTDDDFLKAIFRLIGSQL